MDGQRAACPIAGAGCEDLLSVEISRLEFLHGQSVELLS